MKKSMKKLLSLVMVIAALAALTVPALAADAVVSRQGTNGLVIETTGSGYTDTDLFGNFKNVMPGDELTENITIKNNVSGFDYVKLYIRAEAHDEEGNPLTYSEPFENEDGHDQANIEGMRDETVVTMADFLSKLTMEVYLVNADGTKQSIFSASPDQTAQLTDNVLLGTFAKGKSAKLEAVLTVPAGLGNEYAYRVGEVDWVFTVEGFNNEKPLIPTGQLNWPVAVFGALGVLLIAGGVLRVLLPVGPVYRGELTVAQFAENYNRIQRQLGDAGIELDENGRWKEESSFQSNGGTTTVMFNDRLPQLEYQTENGVLTGIVYHAEGGEADSWISIPSGSVMQYALFAFAGAEKGHILLDKPLQTAASELCDSVFSEYHTVVDGVAVDYVYTDTIIDSTRTQYSYTLTLRRVQG